MSELSSGSEYDAIQHFSETVGNIAFGVLGLRNYMGTKLAREAMDEHGLAEGLDDDVATALEDFMSTPAISGMVLGMRGTTAPEDIQQELERLVGGAPMQLQAAVRRAATYMLPIGIDFYNNELKLASPKSQAWAAEFRLLEATS